MVHPGSVSDSDAPTPGFSSVVLIAPMPTSPYGCTIEIRGASMKFAISVVTADAWVGLSPVNSPSYVSSASNPRTEPRDPREPPQFQFLSRQSVAEGQPALPPK